MRCPRCSVDDRAHKTRRDHERRVSGAPLGCRQHMRATYRGDRVRQQRAAAVSQTTSCCCPMQRSNFVATLQHVLAFSSIAN